MGAACGARHRRRWVALTVSSALLIAGLCGYLYVSVQDLSDDLKCAGDQVSALEDPAGSVGATAVENVPSWMRRAIGQGGAYFDLASLGPALISCSLLLASASCGCRRSRRHMCTRLVVLLTDLSLLLTLVYYIAMAALGLFSDRPLFTDQWAHVTAVCTGNMALLNGSLTSARAQLASAGTASATGSAQAALDVAQAQYTAFVALCGCIDRVPTDLRQLTGAGLSGVGAALLAYFAVTGMCCTIGCCRTPTKVAPEPEPEPEPADDAQYDEEADLKATDDADLIGR